MAVQRKRAYSVTGMVKVIENFGHDRRSNLAQKVFEITGRNRSNSVHEGNFKALSNFDRNSRLSESEVSDFENMSALDRKFKEI